MTIKEFSDFFKLNIIKNSSLYFWLIVWLFLFGYINILLHIFLQHNLFLLQLLAKIQEFIPDINSWPIPFEVLRFLAWILFFVLIRELVGEIRKILKSKKRNYSFY